MESQNSPEGNHFTLYSFCTMNRQSPQNRFCTQKKALNQLRFNCYPVGKGSPSKKFKGIVVTAFVVDPR